jgi:hypothetical protein
MRNKMVEVWKGITMNEIVKKISGDDIYNIIMIKMD